MVQEFLRSKERIAPDVFGGEDIHPLIGSALLHSGLDGLDGRGQPLFAGPQVGGVGQLGIV